MPLMPDAALPDSLLRQAKRVALREHTTVKALIEQGLRSAIGNRTRKQGFKLRRDPRIEQCRIGRREVTILLLVTICQIATCERAD
jgi:hypothetical protein